MQCCIDGCDREARYKAKRLCQKHYFRIRRNGDTDSRMPKARPRIEDERGYQFVHAPSHPLTTRGQIYLGEHRMILYEAIGPGPMACDICGCGLTWETCQADHIDENPRNNARSNLRPLCRRCNTWRSMPPMHQIRKNATVLTFDGVTQTAAEWARDVRVKVAGNTIILRKRKGMSDEAALFGSKSTHNGNPRLDKRPRKTNHKHERANAVSACIGGATKTAAEWAREPGVSVSAAGIIWRLRQGWDAQRAIFQRGRLA